MELLVGAVQIVLALQDRHLVVGNEGDVRGGDAEAAHDLFEAFRHRILHGEARIIPRRPEGADRWPG